MWIYVQRTGNIYRRSDPIVHQLVGSGYSGADKYRNDPDSQCFQDLGPIPRGKWLMGPLQDNKTGTGHVLTNSLRLTPDESTEMCDRDGFLIHGDNAVGAASAGCIILPLEVRQQIGNSSDPDLIVVAEEADT